MISISDHKILDQIYESADSIIYRALQEKDNNPVIIKVLKAFYPTQSEISKYKQEYALFRSLDVEGVLKAHALRNYKDSLVMILEDFKGELLRNAMAERRFSLDEFLPLAIQAAEVLDGIHSVNIVHKNIKPSSFLWDHAAKKIKLIDLSLAAKLPKEQLHSENPNALEEDFLYISPEQTGRVNRPLDYRTDFYSLGIVFYEILTGRTPFESSDAMELVHSHIAKHPGSLAQINPHIPPVLADIVMKLLEKKGEDRYQSAFGLKIDLAFCLKQLEEAGEMPLFELARDDFSSRFGISQKLYGREHEIDILLSTFERVADGFVAIMLVAGYSGIGKSALVKEIPKSLTKRRGYFISGKFDQFQRNIPYSAVVEAFKELVQQLLTEDEIQLSVWKERLLTALGPNGQVIIDVLPEIEWIIGKQPPVPQLGPIESQNRFNLVFQNFMRVFCQQEHPLVLFLDDLQWVDSATLKLLELTTTDEEITTLFLIGAYRDNEVDPSHPLITTLNKLREESVAVDQITLGPLSSVHIRQLIADSFQQDLKAVGPLTDLVMRKTEGNPFFVNQFLHTLYEEDLLHFVPPKPGQKGLWRWDIEQIETLNITDNVVELMIGKLKKLPESGRQVLRLAACVGNRFDLDTLSVIYEKSATDTFQVLMPILTERLILPLSEREMNSSDIYNAQFIIHRFRFLHDRVQQAAYALIDDDQNKTMHLQIGRLMLKNTPAESLEENVFDIAEQFSHCIDRLKNQDERLKIAQLNLMAGQKAKMATAYEAADKYLTIGRECLTKNSWEKEYDLTLHLYTEATETAYFGGNFEQMEQLAQIVLQHARTLSDEVKICEIQILAYVAQNQQRKAIKIALIFLKRLGIGFPEEPTQEDVRLALREMQITLSGKPIQSLIDLPMMTNTQSMLAIRVMVAVTAAAYVVSPRLMVLQALKQIDLSLEHGNVSESSFSYGTYGFILCGVVGDIESGYQFAQLALGLLKRFGEKRLNAKVGHVSNSFVRPWKEDVGGTLQSLLDNYQIGLETGDLEFAAYCIHTYLYSSLYIGKPLVSLEKEMALYSHAVARHKQENIHSVNRVWWQVVLNLTGHSKNPCCLTGEAYDETIELPLYQQANYRAAIYILHHNKCVLNYLFQEYGAAVKNAEIAEQHLDGVTSMILVAIFRFYDSLARLAVYPSLPRSEQNAVLAKVSANQEKMKQWAHHAPMNFMHKFYLVEAERSRALGKDGDAREFYDKAIGLAHENEYINEEALAYELAGQFYLAKKQTKFAKICLFEAHYAYEQWGATAKVENLESRYPHLLPMSHADQIFDTSSEKLDLVTIMKAAQTISSEIVLEDLLVSLMRIVIENAGAQHGYLLLEKKGELVIEAEGSIDCAEATVLQSIHPDQGLLPRSIINYVKRTGKSVVLGDVAKDNRFADDPFIQGAGPMAVLCIPLMKRKQFVGCLYLENNLSENPFTTGRINILEMLSSQAAIAIENATLFHEVKQSEKAFRESEEKYRSLVESTDDSIYLLNRKSMYLFVNKQHLSRLGLQTDEYFGRKYDEFHSEADTREFSAILEKVFETGQPIHQQHRNVQNNRYFLRTLSPVRESDGEIRAITVISKDITERVRSMEALGESEEYHRGLFENSPTALYLQDFSGVEEQVKRLKSTGITDLSRYLRENQKEAFQLSRAVVFSRVNQAAVDLYKAGTKKKLLGSLAQVIIKGDFQHFIDQVVTFTNGKDSWAGEARNYNFQKEIINIVIRKGVINRRVNGMSKVLVSITDVTELHQAHKKKERLETQLQQAQKMEAIGTLAGGIAHDFNNLLMAIQGRTSIMLMNKDSAHPDCEHLRGIESHVEHAADLTKQLLGFARGGKYEVNPTDLNELIKKENRMFGRTKKEITIRGKYENNLWSVEVDRGQFQQVLLNLYVNAWQAMPGGGDLYLETENVILEESDVRPFSAEPGRYVKISITDTGVGMDKATREKIFEPFFTTKEMGRGTGLGLASAYGIIKNHGGFINVYSEKGHGAAFNIYLPASEKEIIEEKNPAGDTLRGTETVLFVDDEDMIIEVAKEVLENLGYNVLTARSGKEAIEIYEENKEHIDIVLLDMIMPNMSGSDTYDRMKAIDPDIKVLLSSGYSIDGQATEILDRGCNGFIQKPFKMKELSQKLRQVLDGR